MNHFQRYKERGKRKSVRNKLLRILFPVCRTDSETESDNEASREGQAGSDPGKQVEDQAGSDPGKQVEGQAGSDPGVAADSQIQPSHVVHAGPNLEHMNLEVSDTSPQPNLEQMDMKMKNSQPTTYPSSGEPLTPN
ncbi:hypothetical protein Tco_0875268 [Tanacetum coccineum]|uniref:Uncharacterized protein n=1 Tax=Tanacetum coccineum TaxID=301880 RepID=A0ABQ5BRT2_9ASTR